MEIAHDLRSGEVVRAFLEQRYDSKEWFDLKYEAERLSLSDGFDRLLTLDTLPIRLYDHQHEAVMRVLRDMRGRALLADEVGLGKTIEAGVVVKEYLLRGLARRVLILVPASLVSQWRHELREKLGLDFSVGGSAASFGAERVVASIDRAKRAENAAVVHAQGWDILVVDEAHRLKNRRTMNWRFVNTIEKKFLLLLTATPIQNDLRELYNLVTLLQPGQLKTYSEFKRDFVIDKHSPRNLPRLREVLSEVMVRRSRRETLIRFARRHVRSLSVPLRAEERQFYEAMTAALRRSYQAQKVGDRSILPLILLLRECCSHPAAARRTLEAMQRSSGRGLLPLAEISELLHLSQIERPAKLSLAIQFLNKLGEKAIVFTEYRATQLALLKACEEAGLAAVAYHGGLDTGSKDAAVESFRKEAQILVSTESGGEGRNLQFCRTLVNYDLPWNPMRLEQRIGRVHRLGQVEEVLVINVVTEGTIDAYVLYLLDKKIGMFQKVVGEIDVILANLETPYEKTLAGIALASEDEAQLRERIESFGRELERACQTYEQARQLNARLFADDADELHLEA